MLFQDFYFSPFPGFPHANQHLAWSDPKHTPPTRIFTRGLAMSEAVGHSVTGAEMAMSFLRIHRKNHNPTTTPHAKVNTL